MPSLLHWLELYPCINYNYTVTQIMKLVNANGTANDILGVQVTGFTWVKPLLHTLYNLSFEIRAAIIPYCFWPIKFLLVELKQKILYFYSCRWNGFFESGAPKFWNNQFSVHIVISIGHLATWFATCNLILNHTYEWYVTEVCFCVFRQGSVVVHLLFYVISDSTMTSLQIRTFLLQNIPIKLGGEQTLGDQYVIDRNTLNVSGENRFDSYYYWCLISQVFCTRLFDARDNCV
jgi:hypothetical protein